MAYFEGDNSIDEINEFPLMNQININNKNLNEILSKTTSKNTEKFIDKNSKPHPIYTNEIEKEMEFSANQTLYASHFTDNFIFPVEPEDIKEIIYVNNFPEKKSENIEDPPLKKDKIIFLNKKIERNESDSNEKETQKKLREDNLRIGVGRNFMNYLLNLIEEMKQKCNCILDLEKFPRDFILQAVKKGNSHYLEYTLEELFENRTLYENKDPYDIYSHNLKVINVLKSEKNKETMGRFGYDKILKMKYRELYELYLKSNKFKQYKQKVYDLYEKKGNSVKEKIDLWFNNFIDRFGKK